jgi:lipopolysaccharide biosynthesis regulator YciM
MIIYDPEPPMSLQAAIDTACTLAVVAQDTVRLQFAGVVCEIEKNHEAQALREYERQRLALLPP